VAGATPAQPEQTFAELHPTPDDNLELIHYVRPHDTLVGISLKYSVTVSGIRTREYDSASTVPYECACFKDVRAVAFAGD